MARQPRIDYPGAAHHVMNRGADHQAIFRDNSDRRGFLNLWSRAVARFGIVVVSYCLMGNHFHLLVESPNAQLSRSLQFVMQMYTQRFNARHGRDGALFRGRFHSVLIDSDIYFERVGRYIELNPVAAGLVPAERLSDYEWSSFGAYAGRIGRPAWLSVDRMLDRYRTPDQYVRFVQSQLDDRQLERFYANALRPGVVLGGVDFVKKLGRTHGASMELTAGIDDFTLDEIDRIVLNCAGCPRVTIYNGTSGRDDLPRRVAVGLAHMLTNSHRGELAERYGYPSPDAVGFAIRRSTRSPDPELKRLREASLKALGLDLFGHSLGR